MRNCIVVGSGRSGTSMLAGALHASGYNMGSKLLPPTPSNPKGYFESAEVNELNNELLTSVVAVRPRRPLGYLYPRRLSKGQLWLADIKPEISLSPTSSQIDRMHVLTPSRPFCLKDPRFCYTLPAWRKALDCDVFLCVFREPGRTASSMVKDCEERQYRGLPITRAYALDAWTSMYQHVIDQHMHVGRWIFAHYQQISNGSVIPLIEDALDAKIDTGTIDTNLMRSLDSDDLPERITRLYRHLCSLAKYTERTD